MIFQWLKRRRRRRLLERNPVPDAEWRRAESHLPWIADLDPTRRGRLRAMVTWFLAEKRFYGAGDLAVNREMALAVSVMSCLPVLDIGFDALDRWTTIIIYPGEFRARHEHLDEAGLVHELDDELAGEAWEGGPLVLSWTDVAAAIEYPEDGENVVIHEIAHKLDMLNGPPNGHPPLPPSLANRKWAETMQAAFDGMNKTLDAGEEPAIDPYAATDPAEFFAVASEYYFEAPGVLRETMPEVHDLLEAFYRPRA